MSCCFYNLKSYLVDGMTLVQKTCCLALSLCYSRAKGLESWCHSYPIAKSPGFPRAVSSVTFRRRTMSNDPFEELLSASFALFGLGKDKFQASSTKIKAISHDRCYAQPEAEHFLGKIHLHQRKWGKDWPRPPRRRCLALDYTFETPVCLLVGFSAKCAATLARRVYTPKPSCTE